MADNVNKKAGSAPSKEAEKTEEADASSADTNHHGNPLLQASTAEADWKTVPVRCPESKTRKYDPAKDRNRQRGRGQPQNSRPGWSRGRGHGRDSSNPSVSRERGPEKSPYVEGRGRTGRGQRGKGFENRPKRPQGKGKTGPKSDHGFTLKNVRYERNKLYVLGLPRKTSRDCVLNFIGRICRCDVRHVLMFEPGRALVTLDPENNIDFDKIREEAAMQKNQLGRFNVWIERAPVCKSIFVSEIPENTSQEEIEKYFDRFGVVEKFVTNTEEVKAGRTKERRAIVYFQNEKSVKKVVEKDHFLDADTLLHVERYYPFMGTVEPPDTKTSRHSTNEIPMCGQPYFRMDVDRDTIEFVMDKCNQGLELKERLFRERAQINWTNRDGYVLVKYNQRGQRLDDEFDEEAWEKRCREIITEVLDRFTMKEIPVEKEIWEEVINKLPELELLFPNFSAQVKKIEDLKELKLICPQKDLPGFEEKLLNRLKDIKRIELEKTLEHKTLTNRPNEILRLLQIVDIQDFLKNDVHGDVQASIDLSKRSMFLKTPQGQMYLAVAYLDKRVEEIEQHAWPSPPEIIEILKTKVGKRKLNAELKEANISCGFNIDEKNNRILLLGRSPSDTEKARKLAETVLTTVRINIKDGDNNFLLSDEWKQLCRDFEKRLKIRCQRRLTEFHVIGLKKDVDEAVKEMRKFLNEKKAKEGEFRFDSPVSQRFFHEYYSEDIKEIEERLSMYSVKITQDENGDLVFTGAVEGVKKVTESLNALQDKIKQKTLNVSLPGMRSFLAKDDGRLTGTVEKEHRCIIEIKGTTSEVDIQEDDSDDESSLGSDAEEDCDDDDETIVVKTPEGTKKKIIWKLGNIEEQEADILVCSVGSNLNLSIGAIARAMSQAAGPKLQDALLKAANNHLSPGEVVHTISGNLPCNHVVFCVCCPWSDEKGDAKQILQTLLWKCFDKASQLGSASICLPLIGTGNLNFPHDVAVQIMVDEALNYSTKCPNSSIEEFRFIVHSQDQDGILTFQETFGRFKEKHQRSSPVPSWPLTAQAGRLKGKETAVLPGQRCTEVCIGDLTVKVVKGDITKECSDGIISILREDLKMQNGNLSAAIGNACGNAVQDELMTSIPRPTGSAVATSAGDLAANYIIHMVVGSGNKQHLRKCVQAALEKVHSMELESVSIPAIGSGGLRLNPRESAEVVLGTICEFFDTVNYLSTLREVRVVVLEDSVIGAFASKLKQIKLELDQACGFTGQEDEDEEEAVGVVLPLMGFQHRVTVYGHQENIEEAIEALKNGVIKECPVSEVTDDVISRLPKRCKKDLRQKAREKDVGLDFSEQGTITLKGFPIDVTTMHTEISKVLQNQLKEEHKMERAEMTAGNVQWCYLSVTGKQEAFEKLANYDIETAFQSKKPAVSFMNKNMQAEIIFDLEKVTFLKTGVKKAVFRKEVVPLPQDWDFHPVDAKGRKERVHLVRLEIDSPEYQEVQDRFLKSISREREVTITSIQRVQNPSKYRSYVTKKQSMDEKNGSHKNEWYLFHGTGFHNVKDINAHGFNRSFCGRNGASFGDGVYFATEASYSLAFSKLPNAKGEYCMYLAKVLVGKFALGVKGMKTPPSIDPDGHELYDSVVNSTQYPTVFVVFHDDQCYPEYLFTFLRHEKR